MNITFNGNKTEIDKKLTVSEFLDIYGYMPDRIAVEINEVIISKAEYDTYIISENDVIEVLSFVGGGSR